MATSTCDKPLDERDIPLVSAPRKVGSPIASTLRVASSFPAVIAAFLIVQCIWRCRTCFVPEPDIWWHLADAKFLVASRQFPSIDLTNYTTAGIPYVVHEWLSELIYYLGFSSHGLVGIFLVMALANSVMWAGVFWLSMRETGDPLVSAVLTSVAELFGIVGLGPRMQVFGWLCFVAMLAVMLRFRSERRAPLWLLPIIFCLWVNLNASWLLGLIVYAIFVCAGLVKRDVGNLQAAPWSNRELKQLIVTGLACVAALFISPFGSWLIQFPYNVAFHSPAVTATVDEFASVNFADSRGKAVAMLLAALFAVLLIGKKRWRIDDAFLTGFSIYLGLSHIRFLLMVAILLPITVGRQAGTLSMYDGNRERRPLNLALIALAIFLAVRGVPTNDFLQKQIDGWFPVNAMKHLAAHPEQGNMFNDPGWGGYLQLNMPQLKTFIDTRYTSGIVHQDYIDVVSVNGTEEILDRYNVSYILYPPQNAFSYFISHSPKWARVYGDDHAVIYRRVRNESKPGKSPGNEGDLGHQGK